MNPYQDTSRGPSFNSFALYIYPAPFLAAFQWDGFLAAGEYKKMLSISGPYFYYFFFQLPRFGDGLKPSLAH